MTWSNSRLSIIASIAFDKEGKKSYWSVTKRVRFQSRTFPNCCNMTYFKNVWEMSICKMSYLCHVNMLVNMITFSYQCLQKFRDIFSVCNNNKRHLTLQEQTIRFVGVMVLSPLLMTPLVSVGWHLDGPVLVLFGEPGSDLSMQDWRNLSLR